MERSGQHRASHTRRPPTRAIAARIALILCCANIAADAQPPPETKTIARPSEVLHLYRSIRQFDFNERPLGNFEKTPMYWQRLEGRGLPAYASGEFDESTGYSAAPSFRLRLSGVGANVCYEYRGEDLAVVPGSDYQVVGYVRCDSMRYSRAFIGAFLVDSAGNRIPGSEAISRLLSDTRDWQRVELALIGDFEDAAALRLQLWILQSHNWDASAARPESIIREDVNASAWFDDLAVYCLPRARLRLDRPGGLCFAGSEIAIEIELSNISSESLEARVLIQDSSGRDVHSLEGNILAPDDPRARIKLPELSPGLYRCRLFLSSESESLLERSIEFAVLAPLPVVAAGEHDVGVDIARWLGPDIDGLRELAAQFGCRAVRVNIPLDPLAPDSDRTKQGHDLAALVRTFVGSRIEPIGVLDETQEIRESRDARIAGGTKPGSSDEFQELLGPALMQLGGSLATWQLGAIPLDDPSGTRWTTDRRQAVHAYLSRHVTLPDLVIPTLDPERSIDARDVLSVLIPQYVPTRSLVPHLEFLTQTSPNRRWLTIEESRAGASREMRLADLMRRFVLARSLAPDRIFLPAPFEQSADGGSLAWQPTEQYLLYRTLISYLARKTADTVIHLDEDCIGIVFRDPERPREGVMIAWTWRDRPLEQPLRAYLGGAPMLIDLWGNQSPLPVEQGRVSLPLSPMPVIVDGVEAPLAHLAASFSIAPDYLDPSEPDNTPTIRFSNTFETTLTGRLEISGPPAWRITPSTTEFSIQSGSTFERALAIGTPPRQVATTEIVKTVLILRSPSEARLEFETPLTVGLRDIQVQASAHWDGPDLVVEQTLRNQSRRPVSFEGRCDAPLHPRLERTFRDVPPGEYRTQKYILQNARELTGRRVRLGVTEVRGTRSLEQLVDIPD
ncbi:MAG: hypothetical protein JNG88_17845 [Phycisphaerales bacterium]|nr:hypothetical protein [Phycisphaerales bacterium]